MRLFTPFVNVCPIATRAFFIAMSVARGHDMHVSSIFSTTDDVRSSHQTDVFLHASSQSAG